MSYIHKRTKIKAYSERVDTFISEYHFIVVLLQVVQKLCVEKKSIIYRGLTVLKLCIGHMWYNHKLCKLQTFLPFQFFSV